MTGWRVYSRVGALPFLAAVAFAGCSGIERPTLAPPAEPRALELGWLEREAGTVLWVTDHAVRL